MEKKKKKERKVVAILRGYNDKRQSHLSVWVGSLRCGRVVVPNPVAEILVKALRKGWEETDTGIYDFAYKKDREEIGHYIGLDRKEE